MSFSIFLLLKICVEFASGETDFPPDPSITNLGAYWCEANHIAIVVSDIGRSVNFYAGVLGMKQVIRPDFDRHGAWLTFGNIDLHLIKVIDEIGLE